MNHGADALYIGAPAFGARQAATNSLEDIEALVRYAHLYGTKVFATVNTIIFDGELESAVEMIRQLYEIGADALIIQDMGLLECGLPPIELHASTQCHNATVERVKFLETVGFKRVILARETSLEQMRLLRESTNVDLEAFVHGALCVSYSGQCYMSQYLNGRSGNRGCCSQPCRSTYDLGTADGRMLVREKHLLSLRDFNASQMLDSMIDAGITSFKIEGRLKDLGYVKNITAYYRQLLDSMMEGHCKASSGRCTFYFTPDPERTFNRGYTDYFLRQRQPMASMDTQKSLGKAVGTVEKIGRNSLTISGNIPFTAGDGLCYFDADNRLQGFLVNQVNGRTVTPNAMPEVKVGTRLWRNHDQSFEKKLQGRSAERRIGVKISFGVPQSQFVVSALDEDGVGSEYRMDAVFEEAKNREKASEQIVAQLSKLGDTPFYAIEVTDTTGGQWFLPAAALNQMRREVVASLIEKRINIFHPQDTMHTDKEVQLSAQRLDYRANVVNGKAEEFYKRHGISSIERGVEQTNDYSGKALMTTKYCLRYELGCCLKKKNSGKPQVEIKPGDTLVLHNNGRRFRLEFDCAECLMRIYSRE